MSLDKAIKQSNQAWKRKEKAIHRSRAVDPSCRNHGNCDWCKENRLHASKVQQEIADAKLDEYEKGDSG